MWWSRRTWGMRGASGSSSSRTRCVFFLQLHTLRPHRQAKGIQGARSAAMSNVMATCWPCPGHELAMSEAGSKLACGCNCWSEQDKQGHGARRSRLTPETLGGGAGGALEKLYESAITVQRPSALRLIRSSAAECGMLMPKRTARADGLACGLTTARSVSDRAGSSEPSRFNCERADSGTDADAGQTCPPLPASSPFIPSTSGPPWTRPKCPKTGS